MGKNRFLLPALLVFFVFYLFLFPLKIKEEYVLVPESKASLKGEDQSDLVGQTGDWAFRSTGKMGYYHLTDGSFSLLEKGSRSSISDRFYMVEEESLLSLKAKSGETLASVDSKLSPVLFGDHFFLADFYQGYIREIDNQGRTLWDYTLPTLITCMDHKGDITSVGLLNGEIYLFDRTGSPFHVWSPGGSRIDVIYGIALSPNGENLGLVSGLDPQRFIYMEKKENGYRPVFHENLSESFRGPLSLRIDDSLNVVVEGTRKGLYYTPGAASLFEFPLPGDFIDSASSLEDGTLFFQSRSRAGTILSFFTETGDRIGENYFTDEPHSLTTRGNRILMTGEDEVYVLRREFH
ncbi:MAG: hypothetical protein PQJ59_13080 [Spirochaetales bacterium]|nr:hypothetical protein [Spirochaetales bacterium]